MCSTRWSGQFGYNRVSFTFWYLSTLYGRTFRGNKMRFRIVYSGQEVRRCARGLPETWKRTKQSSGHYVSVPCARLELEA